jgi:hypothetical protein
MKNEDKFAAVIKHWMEQDAKSPKNKSTTYRGSTGIPKPNISQNRLQKTKTTKKAVKPSPRRSWWSSLFR